MVSEEFNNAGKNIELLAKYNNISKKELAKRIDRSPGAFGLKLKGKKGDWTLIEAYNLSKLFGKTIEEIFLSELIP